MRVLIFAQDYPPSMGGIQTYVVGLAEALAERVSQVGVVAPAQRGDRSFDAGRPWSTLRVPGGPGAFPLVAVPAAAAAAGRTRWDVHLHTQWPSAVLDTHRPRGRGGARVCVAAHGRELLLSGPRIARRAHAAARAAAFEGADACLPVSHYTAALLRDLGVPSGRVHVVPNGVDARRFDLADGAAFRAAHGLDGRSVLLTVGRLVPRKGVDTVIDALPQVAMAVPDVRYVVAGDGPDRARLDALAARRGVSDRVAFVGRVGPDVLPDVYAACDVFVMPTRDAPPDVEGFGLVYLEAGASGRAVIGARAGGVPDAVDDGVTGILVAQDDPAQVAAAAVRLLRDPALRAAMGLAGRARALRSSWSATVDTMLEWL